MTSFPRNDYFFPLMTRVTFANRPSHSGHCKSTLTSWMSAPGAWPVLENGPSSTIACAALRKKKKRSIILFSVPPQCLWRPASVLWPKRLPMNSKNIRNGLVSNFYDIPHCSECAHHWIFARNGSSRSQNGVLQGKFRKIGSYWKVARVPAGRHPTAGSKW